MTCIQPGATTPEDLMASADGNAEPAIVRHLAACEYCAAEVASYARAQNRLRSTFYRITCPPAEVFGDYELGLLPEAERVATARHVLDCPRCTEELQLLRDFLASTPERPPPVPGFVQGLKRIFATAVVRPREAVGELRGSRYTTSRSYTGGTVTVEISQTPEARLGHYAITGLVWHSDDPEADLSGTAELIAVDGTTYESPIDVARTFAFDAVRQGAYQLTLRLPAELVIVDDFQVGT
jgi:hypothetical protein